MNNSRIDKNIFRIAEIIDLLKINDPGDKNKD
jgi:hypothetical protein